MGAPRVTQFVIEPLITTPTRSLTAPGTGNTAVSQLVVEPLIVATSSLRVSQFVVEPLIVDAAVSSDPIPSAGGGASTFGYAE